MLITLLLWTLAILFLWTRKNTKTMRLVHLDPVRPGTSRYPSQSNILPTMAMLSQMIKGTYLLMLPHSAGQVHMNEA